MYSGGGPVGFVAVATAASSAAPPLLNPLAWLHCPTAAKYDEEEQGADDVEAEQDARVLSGVTRARRGASAAAARCIFLYSLSSLALLT